MQMSAIRSFLLRRRIASDTPVPRRPPSRLAGSTVSWEGAAQDDGYATLCDSEEECVTATSVRLRFDRASDPQDTLAGELRVELDDGRLIEGTFEAHRIAYTMLLRVTGAA